MSNDYIAEAQECDECGVWFSADKKDCPICGSNGANHLYIKATL